jgi:hypothetical protein
MPDTTSNSQVFSASVTAQTATFADWFNEIIIVNGSNRALWVNTDGSVATDAEAASIVVEAGQSVSVGNEQFKSNWSGVVGPGGNSAGTGTSQANTPASGFGTSVSFISDAGVTGTNNVVVSAQ